MASRATFKRRSLKQFTDVLILVPRAYDPSGLRQESRALGATISGMRHRCRCAVSRITRIRLFPLFFHNGCSQSSRFLPQTRRIVSSGDENVTFSATKAKFFSWLSPISSQKRKSLKEGLISKVSQHYTRLIH